MWLKCGTGGPFRRIPPASKALFLPVERTISPASRAGHGFRHPGVDNPLRRGLYVPTRCAAASVRWRASEAPHWYSVTSLRSRSAVWASTALRCDPGRGPPWFRAVWQV